MTIRRDPQTHPTRRFEIRLTIKCIGTCWAFPWPCAEGPGTSSGVIRDSTIHDARLLNERFATRANNDWNVGGSVPRLGRIRSKMPNIWPGPPGIDQSWPTSSSGKSDQLWTEFSNIMPGIARIGPKLVRRRRSLTKIGWNRPDPMLTKSGPKLTSFGQTCPGNGQSWPEFSQISAKVGLRGRRSDTQLGTLVEQGSACCGSLKKSGTGQRVP